jgi:hypothetical protein
LAEDFGDGFEFVFVGTGEEELMVFLVKFDGGLAVLKVVAG